MQGNVGRNDRCPCGSGKKYKRCCLDHEAAAARSTVKPPRGELTLLVETPRGPLIRRVPNASPLADDVAAGPAAETATHAAAAVWGLPDFVFLPITENVGSKTREIGDGIVLVANHGLVLQVKARNAASDDAEKEARWLIKQAGEAIGQGNGTIRRLRAGATTLTNLRGREVTIDGDDYEWTTVVVLDHDDPPPDVTPDLLNAKHPAVVLLRRDWQFLFDQLKSTHAVLAYLRRVADKPLELGAEPARFYRLAATDHSTEPEPVDPRLLNTATTTVPMPTLPFEPAASDDLDAHALIRMLLEDIAEVPLVADDDAAPGESQRLMMLGELDRLPVRSRARIGRYVLDAMDTVTSDTSGNVIWAMTSLRGNVGQPHLAYGACSRPYSDNIRDGFHSWLQLRHHDVLEATGDVENLTTVGILVTPREDPGDPWDTTSAAVSGEMDFTEDELSKLRELWPYEGSDS
jgi:hypothetical protein